MSRLHLDTPDIFGGKDPYLDEIERTMPVPVTSFPWQDPKDSHQWTGEMQELLAWLQNKARAKSSIFTADGGRYQNPMSRVWDTVYHALLFVVSTSDPCETHILRGRILDVLEYKFPEQDQFQGDCMAAFGEAQHIVFRKERT